MLLLLFSVCYFKGKWETPFHETNTVKETFYLDSNETDNDKEVDMMKQKIELRYCVWKELEAHAVAIPYHVNILLLLM